MTIEAAHNPNITYTEEKIFTAEQVQALFLALDWVSGTFPTRLYKALMHSSTVITAWDGNKLVGLVRLLDDSELTAFLHYVLVLPEYQGKGIAGQMLSIAKAKYKDFLYIDVMPEESKNAVYYQQQGFTVMPDGVALTIYNPDSPRI